MMADNDILSQVQNLVDIEHQLRAKRQAGEIDSDEEQKALKSVEEALDQCWDLLRQRRAKSEFGEDPDGASARPIQTVEGYLQ
jgi:prephenate dehydratase